MRILAIDDNQDNLTALQAVLADRLPEAQILTALSGPAGLDMARAEDPDVILLDIVMPGMDGYAVCRQLKQDPVLQAIPVLFLTANRTDRASRVKGLETGAEGFLSKPFDDLELIAQIRSMVKIKAAVSAHRTENERLEALVAERTRSLMAELDERKRAEAARHASERALRESEERFRAFFERAPLGYQSLDADGRLLAVNEAWLEALGYAREEVIGRWFGDFLVPECVQEFRQRFSAFKAKGRAHSEFHVLHKNGDRRYMAFDGRVHRGPDGKFERTHCILTDHTERKRTEEALQASEARYRALVENIPQKIFIKDRAFRWVSANENFLQDLGLSLDRIAGKEDHDLFPAELADKYRADDRRIMETGATEEMEERYLRDGRMTWVHTVKVPVRGQDGEITGIFGIFWDITERREAEIALQVSEARLRRAQEIAHVGDWELTVGSETMWASAEAFRIYGLEHAAEDVPLRRVQGMVVAEDQRRMDAALVALLRGERPYDQEFSIVRANDGARRVVHSVAAVESGPDGTTRKVIGTIQDVTTRKQQEAAVRASEERLRDVTFSMGDWVWETDENGVYTYSSPRALDFFGVPSEEVIGKTPFDFMPPEEAQQVAARFSELAAQKAPIVNLENWNIRANGERICLLTIGFPILDAAGNLRGYRGVDRNITRRKENGRLRQLSAEILGILNEPIAFKDTVQRTLAAIKQEVGCDAVGMRLQDGDDFPYFCQEGFSSEFVQAESALVEHNAAGDVRQDADGSISLVCTCGLVVSGKVDAGHPLFTPGGSFWTNDSAPLLDLPADQDPRHRPRNRCIHDGYASMALIPIRANQEIVGLLQLNDRRKGRFSSRQIQLFEGICTSIGIALLRNQAQEQLRASEQSYRNQFAMNSAVMLLIDPADGAILDANTSALDFYGYSRDQLLAMRITDINTLPAAEIQQAMDSIRPEHGEQFQFRHHLADGSVRDVAVASSRIQIGERTVLHSIITDITERKRAEAELHRAQAVLQAAMDQSPAGIAIADAPDGALRYVNNAGLLIRGGDRETLVDGVSINEYMASWRIFDLDGRPLDTDEIPLARAILYGEQCSREFVIQRTAEDRRTVLANAAPIRDDGGEVVAAIVVFLDVTERRKVEETLRETDALLNEVGQIARIGGWAMDLVTRKATWTRTTYDIVEIDPGEPIPGPDEHLDYYLPEYRPLVAEAMRALIEENKPLNFEAQARTGKGNVRWVHAIGRAVLQGGTCVKIHGTLQDITERKRAEERLRASDELLRKLSAQIPGVIYQYQYFPGGHSCFPFASQGVWDTYEVTPLEVRDDGTKIFERMHLADRDRVIQSILDSRDHLTQWACEFRVVLPSKGVRWLRGASNPQKLEDGSVLWHGYATDITEQKQIEGEREKLQGQLQQARKMDAIGQLAGGIAHDFNNMLEVIIGHTEFAIEDADPTQPLYSDLEEVLKAARRSAVLTRQLLTFARKQAISPEIVNLNEAVEGMLRMLRRLIGENIDLDWQPREGLWPVMMDPSQIDQILANLCVNARDAIEDVGTVTIRLENAVLDETCSSGQIRPAPGEYVVLSVSDNGCGMDEETTARIFEPFFTTKEMDKGTGLGLATVYGIVQQNGGGIDICSEPGLGTTFAIYLPRHLGAAPAVTSEAAVPAPRGTETILVVEDEVAILKMAKKMLEGQGYTVLAAATPGEAASVFAAHTGEINLLLIDVIMPEMNGRDLANQLLAVRPHLGCLFMSGYTADVIAQHGVLDEGVHFIQKPFSVGALASKIREALEGNQSAQ